ncbi:hypothetical protein Tco_1127136 [Tanacetum coccineum]
MDEVVDTLVNMVEESELVEPSPRGCHVVTRGCQVNKWVPPADVDSTWTTTWLAADQSEAASWHSYPCRLADLDVRGSELMIGVKWLSLRFSLRSNH